MSIDKSKFSAKTKRRSRKNADKKIPLEEQRMKVIREQADQIKRSLRAQRQMAAVIAETGSLREQDR
jgi:hypothetical protein